MVVDMCFMVGAVVVAVVFLPIVSVFYLFRRAPDYSHMNGHAHAMH